MKKIFFGLLLLLAVVVGILFYGASQSGNLIRQAVLDYGPKATGGSVTLDRVKVAFFGGQAGLSGLVLGNPKGFKGDYAFKVDEMNVEVSLDSLLQDVIRIKEIRIDGADLIYELGTKGNNIAKIQKNIENFSREMGLESDAEAETAARFIVDRVVIAGTKVKLASDLMGGKGVGLTLPDIILNNIGTENKAATLGEVGTAIFGALNKGLGKIVTRDMLNNTLKDVKGKIGGLFK